jgi:hypothetical protein
MSGYSSKAFLEGTRWENFRIMQKCKLVLFFEVFEQEILGLHGILKNNWSYKKFDTKKQLVTWNYKILLTWNSKKQLVKKNLILKNSWLHGILILKNSWLKHGLQTTPII